MRVRIFMGATWATAREQGDYTFDVLPALGDKLAIGLDDGWDVAVVQDVAHRITDPDEAADIAMLVSTPVSGGRAADPLPLDMLDAIGNDDGSAAPPKPAPVTSVPRTAGPWGG